MFDNIKAKLLSNWNFVRIVRLGLGIVILIQAFQMHSIMFGLLGTLFTWQALFNVGCCGAGGCGVSLKDTTKVSAESETTYEEIKKEN
jgi:hypothetical protein